ncbi:MAG: hypothetical protein AB7I30_03215, partial [Isosphaeraceae bacterium]
LVGAGVGWLVASPAPEFLLGTILGWIGIGTVVGGFCGYLLAGYTRRSASRLILRGNQIVLDEIGRETARFLDYVREVSSRDGEGDREAAFRAFQGEFPEGSTERGGRDSLRRAFALYERARLSADPKVRHESNFFANCLAVLHEHIRLQPYISRSLPFLIRKCVTRRLMSYSVGQRLLAVHEDVPSLEGSIFPATLTTIDDPELREFLDGPDGWDSARGTLRNTRANDWTNLRERMSYVVNLFRTRHLDPDVVASPYTSRQLEDVAAGKRPERPW